jgi:hypothetical protein
MLEHAAQKWKPVLRHGMRQNKILERGFDSIRAQSARGLMRLARTSLAAAVLSISLASCMPSEGGLDFAIRSDDGWTGLPIEEMLLRPTLEAQLLAVCFDANCPEPAAVLRLRASGKDARELYSSFDDPQGLAALLNKRDAEDTGAARKAARTRARASRIDVAGLPAFRLSLERADRPERSMHAVAVGKREGDSLDIVLAVAARQDVALLNAESAASELLR